MDPVSPPPNTAAAGTPAAAGPEMSSSSVVGGGARQQQGCGQGTASSQEGTQLASAGAAASAAASGTIGNSSRFNRSSSSNGGGVPAGLGNGTAMGTAAAGRTRVGGEGKAGGGREEYPRLSFCAKPISRRCGICQTKTAIKTTVGHPLSDKARTQMRLAFVRGGRAPPPLLWGARSSCKITADRSRCSFNLAIHLFG